MPEEKYNVKTVNNYIADVRRLEPLQRVDLWVALQHEDKGDANINLFVMHGRFFRQHRAVQVNILYRFGSIIKEVVRDQTKNLSQVARDEGTM